MTTTQEATLVEIHPLAEIFPPMNENEFQDLKESIRKHGQLEPVVLYEEKIIDGRHRYQACVELGKDCIFSEFIEEDVSPEDFVVCTNMHRRHLSPSQLAMIGASLREYHDQRAKERQVRKPKDSVQENLPEQNKEQSRDAAGKAVGVSGRSIDSATKVIKQGTPEVVQAVKSGDIAVSRAAKIVELPKEEQNAIIRGEKELESEVKPQGKLGPARDAINRITDEFIKRGVQSELYALTDYFEDAVQKISDVINP